MLGLERGDVRFECVDSLVELRKRKPHEGAHFFEFVSEFVSQLLQFTPNARMALSDLADVTSKGFGDYAEVSLNFFNLRISHGMFV